ncbi:MAG TPA: aspartate/glutamate racemase family protein [Desulfotignum sp.]|nr:aspartate/glutamate racemase family protein [Desulfotignum sp.]
MTPPVSPSHTIVVTDSGLGGLSVFAGIAAGLARTAPGSGIHLIYVNAWPETDKGYNHYPDMARKAAVFDQALAAMARFRPDALVIACNTLSVIYPHTGFSRTARIPVYDIIDPGVDLAAQALKQDPKTCVILFGTPTTADAQLHARRLARQGFDTARMVSQGCADLAGTIERNPFDPAIDALIRDNVDQAMSKQAPPCQQTAAVLCCTHFGYCRDRFASALARHTGSVPRILDPNQDLADQVVTETEKILALSGAGQGTGPAVQTSGLDLAVFSRVPWDPKKIHAFAALFESLTPQVARALKNYRYNPDLFHIPSEGDPIS